MSGLAADPRRDALLRSAATDISQTIFDSFTLDDNAAAFLSTIAADGEAQTTIHVGGGHSKMLQELGLPQEIIFDLFFAQHRGDRVAGFVARDPTDLPEGTPAEGIILFVLPVGAQIYARRQPYQLWQYVLRLLDQNPDILIHEVTHMLDHLRGKSFMSGKPPPYSPPKTVEDISRAKLQYINNPVEFNAMFQQGMFQLSTQIELMSPSERFRAFRTFRAFKREADATLGITMLNEGVRGKWKKKLAARLWQTYNYWLGEGG